DGRYPAQLPGHDPEEGRLQGIIHVALDLLQVREPALLRQNECRPQGMVGVYPGLSPGIEDVVEPLLDLQQGTLIVVETDWFHTAVDSIPIWSEIYWTFSSVRTNLSGSCLTSWRW